MPKMQTSTVSHGGAGRGQGRKTADGATNIRRITVNLDHASESELRELGGGELSLGIRRAAAIIRDQAVKKATG